MDIQDYEKALRIDKMALERDVSRQPELFYGVADEYVRAISVRDAVKDNLAQIEASMDQAIRERSALSGEKITEKVVAAWVLDTDEYKDAVGELREAQRAVGAWNSLREAFMQRAHALKVMADLFVANYYGSGEHKSTSQRDVSDKAYDGRKKAMSKKRRERKTLKA